MLVRMSRFSSSIAINFIVHTLDTSDGARVAQRARFLALQCTTPFDNVEFFGKRLIWTDEGRSALTRVSGLPGELCDICRYRRGREQVWRDRRVSLAASRDDGGGGGARGFVKMVRNHQR